MEETREFAVVSEDEFEVSASGKGISAKLVGGAASRLGHSLADLISPFSQLAGAIGDGVSALRIYQANALAVALNKANKRIEVEGLHIEPVPTKFLIPWVEGASSEDIESSENLSDLWANLLVSNAVSENPNASIYIDIIRKLSRSHADYLWSLAGKSTLPSVGNPNIIFSADRLLESILSSFEYRSGRYIKDPDKDVLRTIIATVEDSPGLRLEHLSVQRSEVNLNGSMEPSPDTESRLESYLDWHPAKEEAESTDMPDLIFGALSSLELVERVVRRKNVDNFFVLEFCVTSLTPLGWDFMRACYSE